MRSRFFLGLLASLGVAVACSSFSDGDAPTPASDAGDEGAAPDAGGTPQDDAGDTDANPCAFGIGKHAGRFCDDFDTVPFQANWLEIYAPDGGGIGNLTSDAAVSPPNILASFIPAHDAGETLTVAVIPITGSHKVDCRFSVATSAPVDDFLSLFYVVFDEASSARGLALAAGGPAHTLDVQEAFKADGGIDTDASAQQTGLSVAPGIWRRVAIHLEQGKPMHVDIDNGLFTWDGPVPSGMTIRKFVLGVGSQLKVGGGGAVIYDDVGCIFE